MKDLSSNICYITRLDAPNEKWRLSDWLKNKVIYKQRLNIIYWEMFICIGRFKLNFGPKKEYFETVKEWAHQKYIIILNIVHIIV